MAKIMILKVVGQLNVLLVLGKECVDLIGRATTLVVCQHSVNLWIGSGTWQ